MKNYNNEEFRFSHPVNIRWNDLDGLGHVNNVYYFEYFQNARSNYMQAASPHWDWYKHMFVMAHLECDYFRELDLKSVHPVVKLRTTGISNKSFEFEYLIVSTAEDGTDIIHAKGRSIQVLIDIREKKSVAIPDWLRNDLIAYEPALDSDVRIA